MSDLPIRLGYIADDMINSGTILLDRFKAKLANDPCSAMEWSMEAYTGAARVKVGTWLKTCTQRQLNELKNIALRAALRGARYPARSTSPANNILEQELAAAWADLHERLDDLASS